MHIQPTMVAPRRRGARLNNSSMPETSDGEGAVEGEGAATAEIAIDGHMSPPATA